MVRILAIVASIFPVGLALSDEPAKDSSKPDYAEFSKLVHGLIVKQIPKEVQDDSGWGQTVPLPPKLTLPKLRNYVKVGDRIELPHGFWRKIKLTMADPAKDVKINVREFKPTDKKTYKVVLDAEAAARGWTETQHWQKGLQLVGFIAEADTVVKLAIDCEVAVSLDTKKFPPEVKVDPKVTGLKTEVKEFDLQYVKLRRLGTVLEGQQAKEAGEQFKGIVNDGLKVFEPQIRGLVNQAIAQSLKDGKGSLSAGELLKALGTK